MLQEQGFFIIFQFTELSKFYVSPGQFTTVTVTKTTSSRRPTAIY